MIKVKMERFKQGLEVEMDTLTNFVTVGGRRGFQVLFWDGLLFKHFGNIFFELPKTNLRKKESEKMKILVIRPTTDLTKNTEVKVVSGHSRSLRGWSADVILVDSSLVGKSELMEVLRAMVASRKGKIILI